MLTHHKPPGLGLDGANGSSLTIVIARQNPLRRKLGRRTIPDRHCEGAPRLWQSLRLEAITNFRQILVLNREYSIPSGRTERGNLTCQHLHPRAWTHPKVIPSSPKDLLNRKLPQVERDSLHSRRLYKLSFPRRRESLESTQSADIQSPSHPLKDKHCQGRTEQRSQ